MPRMRHRSWLISFAWLCSVFLLALASASTASPQIAGRYGQLAIAVVRDRVHGVFAEGRIGNGNEESPQFSCLFLLEGRLVGHQAKVVTWFPGERVRIAGTLRLGKDPSLQLDENHGGCLMTSGDMKDKPFTLDLDEPRVDWVGAGLVTAKRAILRDEPDTRSRQKRPYLVEFDAIAVLEKRPGWVQAEYLGSGSRPITGWLRDSEVAASVAASE